VIFIGHSHVLCVLNAAKDAGLPFRAVLLKDVMTPEAVEFLDEETLIVDRAKPEFSDATKSLLSGSDDTVYSFVSGIHHVRMGTRLLASPSEEPFDFILPEAPDLPLNANATLIPYECVRQAMEHGFRKRLRLLRWVAELAPGRVVQFAPPPPAPAAEMRRFARKKGGRGAASPDIVLQRKLWRTAIDVFRQQAEAVGARYVDCPPDAIDHHGCMRKELVSNMTHGNAAFGTMVLDQIRSLQ
jgi:hypothetical protein